MLLTKYRLERHDDATINKFLLPQSNHFRIQFIQNSWIHMHMHYFFDVVRIKVQTIRATRVNQKKF